MQKHQEAFVLEALDRAADGDDAARSGGDGSNQPESDQKASGGGEHHVTQDRAQLQAAVLKALASFVEFHGNK